MSRALLRQTWLDSSIQIKDVVFELDVQSLLGGAGNVGFEDQAIGAFVNVDRRRVSLSRRLSILLDGAWLGRAATASLDADANLTLINIRCFNAHRCISPAFINFVSCSDYRATPDRLQAAGPEAVTEIRRGLAVSAFGKFTVRIPSANDAPTWVLSTRSGSVIVRTQRPIGRSCRR